MVISGGGAATTASPTLSVEDGSTLVGETTTVTVMLSSAPDGLSGFDITVYLQNPDVGHITDVSLPDHYGLTNVTIGAENDSIRIRAVDTTDAIKPGATDIVFAELTIAGETSGTSDLGVTVTQIDDDAGDPIQPTISEGTLSATEPNQAPSASLFPDPSSPVSGQEVTLNASESHDSDGSITEYRWDVDGDGTIDHQTEAPTLTTSYESAGSVSPSVTVVDDEGATGTASTTVEVDAVSKPTIELLSPESTGNITPEANVSIRVHDPALPNGTVSIEGSAGISEQTLEPSSTSVEFLDLAFTGEGPVSVTVNATNHWGKSTNRTIEFTLVEPPTIDSFTPSDAALVNGSTSISATYGDDRSGVDPSQVTLSIDGDPVSASPSTSALSVPLSAVEGLTDGSHTVTLVVTDNASFTATQSRTIELDMTPPGIDLAADQTNRVSTNHPTGLSVAIEDASPSTGTLTITNSTSGSIVRHESVISDATSGSLASSWNGTNSDGTPVPSGKYTVMVDATDQVDNSRSETIEIQVDNTPPKVGLVDIRNDTSAPLRTDTERTVPVAETLAVNVSADGTPPDSANTTVEVVLNATFTNYEHTTIATYTSSDWEASVPVDEIPDDGTYRLEARATDPALNTNRSVATSRVRLDRRSPRIGATVSRESDTAARINLTTTESIDASTLAVSVTYPNGTTESVSMTEQSGRYTGTFALAESSGEYQVSASAADAAGNTASDTASATIQTLSTENKTVTVVSETSGTFIRFNTSAEVENTFITLTTSDAPLSPLSAELLGASFLNGQLGHKLTENMTNATIGIPVADADLPTDVSPGDVTIRRYNASRNEWVPISTSVETVTLADGTTDTYWVATVQHFSTYGAVADDTDPPTLTSSSPSGDLAYGTATTSVRFEYEDTVSGVNVSAVDLYFDGARVTTAASASITSDAAVYNATDLTAGETYTGTVRVVDQAGNAENYSTTFTVPADTEAPQVTPVSPSDGESFSADTESVTLRVEYSDARSGVATESVQVLFDGVDVTANATIGGSALTYTATDLSAGSSHTLTVRVADAAGNGPTTEEIQFSIDNATEGSADSETSGGSGGGGGGGRAEQEITTNSRSFGAVIKVSGIQADLLSAPVSVSGAGTTITEVSIGTQFEPDELSVFIYTPTSTPSTDAPPLQQGDSMSYFRMNLRDATSHEIDQVIVQFTVADAELPSDATSEQVTLYRYHDGAWHPLTTNQIQGTTYEAVAPGFSEFAIGIQPTDTKSQDDEPTGTPTKTTTSMTTTATTTQTTTTPTTTTQPSTSTDVFLPGFGPLLAVLAFIFTGVWRHFTHPD